MMPNRVAGRVAFPTPTPPYLASLNTLNHRVLIFGMKKRRILLLLLPVAVAFAFVLSQPLVLRYGRSKRVVVARDDSDISGVDRAKAKAGYDPYFNRVNYSGAIVIPGTNAIPAVSR
jgi:hypothetical protein